MNEDKLIAEVERRLKGHKDDLSEGTRVKITFDEVIPSGTLGTVNRDYVVSRNESLAVRVDSYVNREGQRSQGGSVWYLNRFPGRTHPMNCPICHDIIVDTAYAKCEWCRLGAPMEAALEGPSFSIGEGRRALGEAMSGFITDNLKMQGIARSLLPVQQIDRMGFTGPIVHVPTTKDSIRDLTVEKTVTKVADAVRKGLGIPKEYLGLGYDSHPSSRLKYMEGWNNTFGKKDGRRTSSSSGGESPPREEEENPGGYAGDHTRRGAR